MATNSNSGRPSSLDRMLEESRREFEALYRVPKRGSAPPAVSNEALAAEPSQGSASGSPQTRPPAPSDSPDSADSLDIRETEIGRMLANRFADRWRCDVVDTRRDGDDVMVWVRLTVGEIDHDKTRRGRARIHIPGGADPVMGHADGTTFILQAGDAAPPSGSGDPEATAREAAIAMALAACAKGI